MNIFVIRLKKLISENNLSNIKIAQALNCSENTIRKFINELEEPTLTQLKNLAMFLDTSTDYLLGLTNARIVIKIFNSFNNNNGNISFKG